MFPKYLEDTILDNATSVGDNPALPPEEENPYLLGIVREGFEAAMQSLPDGYGGDAESVKEELDRLVLMCQKRESAVSEALESLCCNIMADVFAIPEDTINIEAVLVSRCDMSKYRMVPEPSDGFQFDDTDEMEKLSEMIYQRRMVDSVVSGAAAWYAGNIDKYRSEIAKIDPSLPPLYRLISIYRNALVFLSEDTVSSVERQDFGVVDVTIPEKGEMITVHAEGTVFPYLLEQTFKGLLETAALRGMPKNQEKAEYIMKKADYRLAENWDYRIGTGLWETIANVFYGCGVDIDEVGPNFIIMEIASMNPGNFNIFMRNLLKGTRKGAEMAKALAEVIQYNKETDDFDNFVKTNNGKYQINDDEYTPDELLAEAESDLNR